ncbi:MAG: type II toxin-antitoxin system prevent-host-death family antitoxin [Pseudomonadota bacterium]|uniref:Antitoxin n=1 Tax=Candidatus Desulfatibia profunda TaxID=2841695 RepID=A0A8J6NUA7_9BACT|nr:type II toxin-antitoxin system prevent-host-death family antitoxin [Candidatus Desulfatibia profunda]MBL7179488.1 type II toxin-antitoxin system prevent-host-death family antitoxin [Desulfobacterales bacterium]
MQPIRVGIRDAKMHLSKFIKMVQNGSEVILTDRGRPVGKIVPLQPGDLPLSARIQKLEDMGVLKALPQKKGIKLSAPIPVPNDIAQTFLKEDRNNA